MCTNRQLSVELMVSVLCILHLALTSGLYQGYIDPTRRGHATLVFTMKTT